MARLFVSAANTNSVYTVGVSASNELQVVENINLSMTPRQPLGMTPSALALGSDGNRLYVVCSDANAVAVVDVSQDRSDVLGFVPTGWYPTAARGLSDGRLVVLNGRGLRSLPNPARTESDAPARIHLRRGQRGGIRGPHPNRHGVVYRSHQGRPAARVFEDRPGEFAVSRRAPG